MVRRVWAGELIVFFTFRGAEGRMKAKKNCLQRNSLIASESEG